MKRAITLAKINHPWNRYDMRMLRSWPIKIPNMNKMRHKRQMTSCVHKMCEQTYGQTNMKRAITLAKINHPWNQYDMRMLRSWPIKIPNMNKMRQKTSCVHKMCGRMLILECSQGCYAVKIWPGDIDLWP